MIDHASLVLGDRVVNPPGSEKVVEVALMCGLTAYDAEFVVLARLLGVAIGDRGPCLILRRRGSHCVRRSRTACRTLADWSRRDWQDPVACAFIPKYHWLPFLT